MAELYRAAPKTFGAPTMSASCADGIKYQVVDDAIAAFQAMHDAGERPGGHAIRDLNTVNGVRCTLDDGSWCLVRASSNKPGTVVVVESLVSKQRLYQMFTLAAGVLRRRPEVGACNQTL